MALNPKIYSKERLSDRQVSELIGIARGILADGNIVDAEIEFLQKWLVAHQDVSHNSVVAKLVNRIDEVLHDNVVTEDERADLLETLQKLTSSDFELGEELKATTLPIDDPAPAIKFEGMKFTFTGTFTTGQRKDCEKLVCDLGATAGSLTRTTNYLVIGEYATDSWQQSSFGRKIEKACTMQSKGIDIKIITEKHWHKALSDA